MAAPSPPPLSQFATAMCKTATMVFRKEIARLAEKRNGFHCNATHFKAEAFETLSMETVGAKYRELAPCTVELFSELLDSVPRRRHASAPLSSIRMDIDEEHQEESADHDILGLEEIEASEDPQLQRDLENWLDEEEEGFRATATAEGESVDESPKATASRRRERKSRRMARIRNECLKRIKSVIVLSILMQSSNEHCNMLQTVIGFFLNSVHTPSRVIDLLSHTGISVSASTLLKMDDSLIGQCKDRIIQAWKGLLIGTAYDNLDFTFKTKQPTLENGGRFLSTTSATFLPLEHGVTREDLMCSKYLWDRSINNPNAAASLIYQPGAADFMPPRVPEGGVDLQLARKAWHIRSILVEYCSHFRKYKKDLGVPVPGPIEQRIPPKKTTQIPAELMEIKESTADGNAEVVSSLLRQAGLSPGDTNGMVLLFHGDLATLERLQAIMFSRGIEDEEWNRFQSVVFIPGLFHAKMAAADALWRIYIKPESPGSPSVARDAGIMRPKEIGKIKATPTFRQLHDTITYSLAARVLDCWRIVAQRVNPEFQDLAKFAQSEPGWESIVGLSRSIAEEFVAGHDFARSTQGKPADERDYVRENAMLWLRHALLYTELSHAMNHGDIGRVEEALKSFAFVFDGCGKHKYSVQLSRFLISLNKIYPPRLARAIRMNWLVNPSGKPDGFRAVDWQLELNNLYTKVIHGGSASNHTIGLIRKRSILIELYRGCHAVIERNFSLPFNSTRHSLLSAGR